MAVLDQLEPKAVFHWFEALSAIPRGSRQTEAVSAWCVEFAKARGLEVRRDAAGNVVIAAPASPGYEDAETVILQGHLDMVCEKEPGNPIDMERQGVQLVVDGEYVRADGTTLGGDDGIAVAMILAVLDDPSIPRPRLEAVLTTDEEIGMLGAAALDASALRGRRLLNLDSENEGVFTVSCAGGCVSVCTVPVTREAAAGSALQISVMGLTGGHSGTEIHHGRANANIVLGRILHALREKTALRLVRADGGLKDNAIPVSADAVILADNPDAVMYPLFEVVTNLKEEFAATDPGFLVDVMEAETAETPMDAASTDRVIRFLSGAPDGVQAMSADIPGLVQTSLNLGILNTAPGTVTAAFSVRSSVEAEKTALTDRVARLAESVGGTAAVEGDYPGWAYRPDSPLRRLCVEVFREQYGREPKIEAVHAGLECGVLCGKLPGLDCLSLGPDIPDIHTPRERLSIPSTGRVWAFLLEVLKRSR